MPSQVNVKQRIFYFSAEEVKKIIESYVQGNSPRKEGEVFFVSIHPGAMTCMYQIKEEVK